MARQMKEIFDARYGKITIIWTDNDDFEMVQTLNKRIIKTKTFKTLDSATNWIENHYFSSPEDLMKKEAQRSESEYLRKEANAIRECYLHDEW